MKSKLVLFLIFFISVNFLSSAQKNINRFQSINSIGLVVGESEPSTAFQTVNGIHFSNWFSGIGIGIDNYKYKKLPLFFDIRRYFGPEKRGFVYGDIGHGFPMKNKPGKEIYYNTYHFNGGIYTDVGIGYQFPLYKKSSFLISMGYSYKKLQSKIGETTCPFMGPCFVDYSTYDFSYSRIILKAGFVF